MQTLEDFLKDKTLPIKVRGSHWPAHEWFDIHYAHAENYYGHDYNSAALWLNKTTDASRWFIYQPPKETVKKWLWAVGKGHRCTGYLYTEEKANQDYINPIKLEHTLIEVPVDE